MVEFNKHMQESMVPQWKHAYLNYRMLKKQLGLLESYLADSNTPDQSMIWLKLLFQRTLDGEISKLVDFYSMQVAELRAKGQELGHSEKERVLAVLNMKDVSPAIKIQVVQTYQDQWRDCGRLIKNILEFVSLNLRALRKIVKKQNKMVGSLEPGASPQLQATLHITHPHEGTVFTQGSFLKPEQVREVEAMVEHAEVLGAHREVQVRLTQAAAALRQLQSVRSVGGGAPRSRASGDVTRASFDTVASGEAGSPAASSAAASAGGGLAEAEAGALVARARVAAAPLSGSRRGRAEVAIDRASERAAAFMRRDSMIPVPESPGSIAQDSVILEILEAEADARRNAALVRPMEAGYAVTAGIFEPAPAEDRATGLGLSLNLVNVFLYMTNYNLIIPTIGPFCERLRVPASTGGLVIGCADFMAILVAVGYSVWSNRTFKRPLLFASVVCGVGNLLVTLSYDAGSLPLLLAGRLLTGAGNGRILNRRYIADFVSLEGRTIASIGFVAASAAGMAVGPFIAVPLTALLRGYHDTLRFAGLTINVITVEGWLMVAAWAAFFVIAVLYFDEPLAAEAAEEPDAAEAEAAAPAANGADDGITEPLLPPPAAAAAAVGEHAVAAEAGDEMGDDAGSSDGGASPPHDAVAAELGPDPFATAALPPASSLPPASADAAAESAMKMLGEDGTAAEQPLLAHFAEVLAEPSLLPTVACTVMLFLLKLLQQGSVSAVPVFTEDFYGWRAGAVGLFMTATSLAMIPVNFSVAGLATLVSDRMLMGVSLAFCGVGCLVMVSPGGDAVVSLALYVTSVALVLSFTNVLEGVSMSVLSKVIHPALARGTFNAGLVATQAGSLGRLVGNFSISVFGGLVASTVALANVMFLSFAACVALCVLLFAASYSRLRKQDSGA